jgi:thiamine biosynthesis lipoprotein
MTGSNINRRRFIAIVAAAAGAGALPRRVLARGFETVTWRGVALGAQASLTLQHPDEGAAKSAIAACLDEVARLEAIFSLHQPDSALARLNASGRLDAAPADLRVLLAEALALAERSGGAFDPTVQPLWTLYAHHFSRSGADPQGPAFHAIARAKALIDWRRVEIEGACICLGAPGMAITLNGIAQGYITDRVGALLRQRGFEYVLVNMGEQLALGPKWDGAAWRVGIANPAAPQSVLTELALKGGAVATSGGYGYRFDAAGRFTHILDPDRGAPARQWASVTVVADRAAAADGLSTALTVAPAERVSHILPHGARAFVVATGSATGYWL